MKYVMFFLFLLVGLTLVYGDDLVKTERMVIRFLDPDPQMVHNLLDENYDIAAYKPNDFLDVVVNWDQIQYFRDLGYEPVLTQTEEQLKNNIELRDLRIDGYRTYNDVLDEIQALALEYPDLVRIYDLGDSWAKIYTQQGNNYYQNYQHDIWAVKVTTDPDDVNDKPAVFYMGAHHAREPLSTEVTMAILNLILENYETDDEINYLVDNTEIWFIPIVNPDGHKIVLNQVDVWWRKNIRDNNNSGTFNTSNYYGYGTDGVDLNRNYSFEWAPSSNNSHPTYPGPFGGSEPEVSPMQQLMADHHFVAGITYHTYSELVLYPYGYANNVIAPDVAALSDLAVEMATATPRYNSAGHYTPQASWELYPARGVTDDYAYGMHGIFCYTVELATEFIPPPAAVQQIVSDNMEAALILLRRIHHSTLTGLITDILTGEPVVAEIFIDGIDNTGEFRNPYLSNQNFGRYFRILLPGQYTVQFSAPGYYTSEALPFSINDLDQTVLNYEMIPLNIPEISNIFGGDGFVRMIWELPIEESDTRQDLQRTSEPQGFNIYRNDIHLNPNELITENMYYDYDVINGQSYNYQLTAVYQEGESLFSELVTAIPLEDALISPDNLTISILGDAITIEWVLQENALGYHIYTTGDPYAEEWEYLDYTTGAEWSGNIDNNSRLFFRVTAEY